MDLLERLLKTDLPAFTMLFFPFFFVVPVLLGDKNVSAMEITVLSLSSSVVLYVVHVCHGAPFSSSVRGEKDKKKI